MPVLDRSQAPAAAPFHHIPLPAYRQRTLSNGMRVFLLPFGSVEVVQVQALFRTGVAYQTKTGLARFTTRNMLEGTTSYTSLEFAQTLDRYGAWINPEVGNESLAFSLATITDNLPHTLPLLREVLTQPTFPAEEYEQLKDRSAQKMQVSEQKTSYQAKRRFRRAMFGKAHPYGNQFGREELALLSREDLQAFYQEELHPQHMLLSVVGKFEEESLMAQLEAHFGDISHAGELDRTSRAATAKGQWETGRIYVEREGLQASLQLGHRGVNRFHPDYYHISIMNTLLGGYFGSRLMKNIREEKGYTYGIYSRNVSQRYEGYFVVGADVGNEYIEPTISEIKKEMKLLMDKGVESQELEVVKNYLLGQSISHRETPFDLGDLLRFSWAMDITFAEIDKKFQIITDIQPADIQEMAQKYLRPDDMLEVVAGQYPAG
ncbi:MAG: pitrilysin family protein [Bacteroidota bacterium]